MKLRLALCLLALTPAACPSDSSDAQPARTPDASAPTPAPAAPALLVPPAKPELLADGRSLMGTWFELKVEQVGRKDEALAALRAALDEIARLEDVLSEWRPHTELSRINAQAGGDAVAIGEDTLKVLETGLEISRLSDGAFDMTWAALRGLYRFERGAPAVLPDPKEVKRRKALVGYRDLALDTGARTARLKRAGMAVGTGAIAKGYALDRAAQILEGAGFTNYLLFAGGQVQVHGSREGRAWRVGIKHPRKDGHVGFFEVHDGSISTSGDYEHSYLVSGKRVHHIIDPKSGLPASKSASVTLISQRGIDADALSTACFVLGPKGCLELLEKRNDGSVAVIIDPDLRVTMSPALVGRVAFNPPLQDGRLPQ